MPHGCIVLIRMPRHLPPLRALLADLGSPTAKAIGEALGVNQRTVKRWLAADVAPRPAMLALFWLSRWGRSQLQCEALNETNLKLEIARCLADESQALAGQIDRLTCIADFGSANDPAPEVIAADTTRMALKAFLEEPTQNTPAAEQDSGQSGPSTAGATAEETQHPRGLRHG